MCISKVLVPNRSNNCELSVKESKNELGFAVANLGTEEETTTIRQSF